MFAPGDLVHVKAVGFGLMTRRPGNISNDNPLVLAMGPNTLGLVLAVMAVTGDDPVTWPTCNEALVLAEDRLGWVIADELTEAREDG